MSVCHFSCLYENPALVYCALADAGCSAIILVTNNYVPGAASHIGSTSYSDYQVHYQDTAPFLAIGRDAGSVLKQRLISHPDEPIHTFFTEKEGQKEDEAQLPGSVFEQLVVWEGIRRMSTRVTVSECRDVLVDR